MKKKLSLVVAVVMLISCMNMTVWAYDDGFVPSIIGIFEAYEGKVIGDDNRQRADDYDTNFTGILGLDVVNGTIVTERRIDEIVVTFIPNGDLIPVREFVNRMHVADYITEEMYQQFFNFDNGPMPYQDFIAMLRQTTMSINRVMNGRNVEYHISVPNLILLNPEFFPYDDVGRKAPSQDEYHGLQNEILKEVTSEALENFGEVSEGAEIFVEFGEGDPEKPELYAVRVESNPVGVATFAGYGTGFSHGEAYNVTIDSSDADYVFTGWVGSPSGTIDRADVSLVANFEKIPEPERYSVTAVSSPAGVATFNGTGNSFLDGDTYKVTIDTEDPDYVFTGWTGVPEGNIAGADVELVANYELIEQPIEDEEVPEEPTEEPEEDILDEDTPEEVPDALPETGGIPLVAYFIVGGSLTGLGLKSKKRK